MKAFLVCGASSSDREMLCRLGDLKAASKITTPEAVKLIIVKFGSYCHMYK